jgi:hypothetical protein
MIINLSNVNHLLDHSFGEVGLTGDLGDPFHTAFFASPSW